MSQNMGDWRMKEESGGLSVSVTVRVTDEGVNWTCMTDGLLQTRYLKYRQILGTSLQEQGDDAVLCVYFVTVLVDAGHVTMRHRSGSFRGDVKSCKDISVAVNTTLKTTQAHRPKQLLVFINPMAGSQKSLPLYIEVVEPLFNIAGVTAHVIETKYEHHAWEVCADYNMDDIDTVVSMGGDGSSTQIFNAMMMRVAQDANFDDNDDNLEPVKPRMSFAVLPGGSGCSFARAVNYTIDLETSAITIILGAKVPGDVSVVRERGSVLRYCNFCGSTDGGMSKAVHILEDMRWLKKARYWFILPTTWWVFRPVDIHIEYLQVPENKQHFKYQLEANPSADNPTCSTVDGPLPNWKTFEGNIDGILFANSVFYPHMHWSRRVPYQRPIMTSGALRILIDKSRTFWAVMKVYSQFMSEDDNVNDPQELVPREHMEQIEISELRVKVPNGDSPLYVSGEACHSTEYHVKIFPEKYDVLVIDDVLVSEALEFQSNG